MSEIQTSMDLRHQITVWIQNSFDFSNCLKSNKKFQFSDTFVGCLEYKHKILGFRHPDFSHLLYFATSKAFLKTWKNKNFQFLLFPVASSIACNSRINLIFHEKWEQPTLKDYESVIKFCHKLRKKKKSKERKTEKRRR